MILRNATLACCLLLGLCAVQLGAAEPNSSAREQLITLETSEKPLDVVLQWISRRSGVNIVSNETELPKVTIRLVNVTWQEAIEQIARRYDFVIERRSDRIWELSRPPKVRMEFQDALLTVILDALARQAEVNIVISDRIDGGRRLTMKLNGVPWREALDVIVRTTGYEWIEGNYNIIRIVSPDDVQRDLQTRVVRLNYADGANIMTGLNVALSPDGQVQHDIRTNSLIITDTPIHLDRAADILRELDRRTKEVQIEIKFVEFATEDALNWGFTGYDIGGTIDGFGSVAGLFAPFSSSLGGTYVSPPPNSSSLNSAQIGFEASASLTTSEVIQAPNILTLDNEEAEISITRRQSFAEQTTVIENGQTVGRLQEADSSPLESGINIKVKPHITDDGFVTMSLEATDSTATLVERTVSGQSIQLPEEREKRVKTNILVGDGETAVIGGLLSNQVDETDQWVPLLGRIPVLGYLFRNETDKVQQRNLTIFITPRIVQLDENDDLEDAKLRLREQLSGLDLRPQNEDGSGELSP
ncbi:MAG: hypothetical protein PF961_13825 [Planctomycetota bacterium]|jgi:type IV pilus assembly protein PilQ|nr:hypothetical protein [Planctomycetota bacterium]